MMLTMLSLWSSAQAFIRFILFKLKAKDISMRAGIQVAPHTPNTRARVRIRPCNARLRIMHIHVYICVRAQVRDPKVPKQMCAPLGRRSWNSCLLQHDLQDGVILIQLTEALTGREMTFDSEHGSGAGAAYHLSPQTQEQKMENLRRLIGFQRRVGIPTSARPEDIYNGNTTAILNLLWMMVDSYCVSIVKEGEYSFH